LKLRPQGRRAYLAAKLTGRKLPVSPQRRGIRPLRGQQIPAIASGEESCWNKTETKGEIKVTAAGTPIARLEGITVLADDVAGLAAFYRDALGMRVEVSEANYVAFGGEGIRFAIFSRIGMGPNTHDHPDYRTRFTGQAFELNFECASAEDVKQRFAHIVANGGRAIAEPVEKHWGQFTGFFADPEGNIHSLFAVVDTAS
jgi:catechol 2,3-dioxygenase-like lactoylglutathione lyase family enzyme